MSWTNILSKSIFMNIDQSWQNVQFMTKRERKVFINEVMKITGQSGGFINFSAKYYLASLIHNSEPYFNGKGTQTEVKEFAQAGWYKEGKLNFDAINK